MLSARRVYLALGAVCLLLCAFTSATPAAVPTTVTVRVEGLNETLLPATQVTTTTTPVVKDGNPEHSCPGTGALGALQMAADGNWSGPWEPKYKQYELFSIEGETHEFGSGAYWDLWINNRASELGACEAHPETGQEVLFFPCSETAPECSPLGLEAPATAAVGEPVSVTVVKYSEAGVPAPAAGVTITAGSAGATTQANGTATLKFSSAGEIALLASETNFARTRTTICVHAGDDGTCGTPAPTGASTTASSSGVLAYTSAPYKGPFAIVARETGLRERGIYRGDAAPRLLQGTVSAHSALEDVELRLTRRQRSRGGRYGCSYYDGITDRFRAMRCGAAHGTYFSIGAHENFSYLLPSALAPGRYVLDIEATDAAGNHTTLVRGSSRTVFYVA